MRESQSISKKERGDLQSGRDLLSDLPLSIIHIILDLIPLRDAVRTSILSREWRYTWASLPRLVLDKKCVNPEGKSRSEFEDCMKKIIAHVLSHHKGPIHKFEMSFCFEISCPEIDEWILCFSRNDIKELILDMGSPDYHLSPQVRSSIYSCEKLTKLKLENCDLDPLLSTFKGFMFLTCLSLHDVDLSPDTFESLVANSPLLERIEFREFDISDLRISAPNLKYIYLHGDYTKIRLHAPLLSEMYVLLTTDDNFIVEYQRHSNSVCPYTNFFGGLTNLEKLSGNSYFVKHLSMDIESCHHHTLVFHHLTDIELSHVNFEDINEIDVVARLIIAALNLQKLKVSTNLDVIEKYDSESPYVRFGCPPGFSFKKLRFVTMEYISGFQSEMEFMFFLLQNSPVLEEMKLDHSCARDSRKKEVLVDELLSCGWASPNAKLLTRIQ